MTVSEGERILANWSNDQYWYSGTICKITEKEILVIFDDGMREFLTIDKILPFDLENKTKVEARWHGEGTYYAGVINKVKGEAIRVLFNSGELEWLPIGLIRFII